MAQLVNIANIQEFLAGVQAKTAAANRDGLKAAAVGATLYAATRSVRASGGKKKGK